MASLTAKDATFCITLVINRIISKHQTGDKTICFSRPVSIFGQKDACHEIKKGEPSHDDSLSFPNFKFAFANSPDLK